ncbi:hypothetical protein WBG78_23985 [Chryseolinea sp. T2]|uniref:hypothetical protein n=1 Tax=Chryseolinea sp. T2 TaxID=3129255 RepID=UPI003076A7C0
MKVHSPFLSLLMLSLTVCLSANSCLAQATPSTHYVCIMNDGTYHDRSSCALLQLCSGAKFRKTSNVENLRPCKKCARPVAARGDFHDIKRILGVKDRKQIADSIGTAESVIKREGYTLRILGSPGTKTINTLEFFLNDRTPFISDSLLSNSLFRKLGLNFEGCRADTVRNLTPHPVTKKVDPSFTIEYRNCAIVERRDAYDDISKYYYRLSFVPNEADQVVVLEKIQLVLTAER